MTFVFLFFCFCNNACINIKESVFSYVVHMSLCMLRRYGAPDVCFHITGKLNSSDSLKVYFGPTVSQALSNILIQPFNSPVS